MREAVPVASLSPFGGVGTALGVALASRLILTVADVLAAGVAAWSARGIAHRGALRRPRRPQASPVSTATSPALTDDRPQPTLAPTTAAARRDPRHHVLAPLTMLGAVLLGICAPLLRAPTFYYWDDTAGASVGAWRHTAEALLDGRLPLLSLELWRGGNYAAEAAFGMFNPLLLGLYVLTKPIDDLAVVAVVIKGFFFLAMALGAYLVCRAYGVRPWVAALAGTILPVSGFTLWMDGAAWVTGLTVTALTPWVLWTGKRAADGRGSLVWAVVAGYLCCRRAIPTACSRPPWSSPR